MPTRKRRVSYSFLGKTGMASLWMKVDNFLPRRVLSPQGTRRRHYGRKPAELHLKNQVRSHPLGFYLIWPVLAVFMISTVYSGIQMATSGAKLALLEKKQRQLSDENQQLTSLLIEATSLTRVEEAADELGFVKPEVAVYVSREEAVAKLP